jgi:unsaturated pyranuronate lyase
LVDGSRILLKAEDVLVIPPNAVHSGRALTELRLTDVFSPVREDYRGTFGKTVLSEAMART